MSTRKGKTPPPKVRRINLASRKFQANGKVYYIQDQLSVERYVEYNKRALELVYDVNFEQLHATITKIHQASTSGNDLIAALKTCGEESLNLLNAIVDFTNRDHPSILRFCALFINREGEDTARWDERLVEEKVTDWRRSGIDIADFFFCASNFIPTFRAEFREAAVRKGIVTAADVEASKSNPADASSSTTTSADSPLG